jgi:spore coat polysaccharide biosynthesis protein SpsF
MARTIQNVCIGIQARSTSSRFPRKVFELIGGKPMLSHVIETCDRSAFYLNRYSASSGIRASHALLVPKGDEIRAAFGGRCAVIEGPEDDVLARYVLMAERLDAQYIVRVTSDCPLIPPYLITKLVKIAVANQYDYCSNVDPKYRTALDGHDIEVMSRRALEWADENAKEGSDREHVTPILRTKAFQDQFSTGFVVGHLNNAHVKLSVDTYEDLERVRVEYDRVRDVIQGAEALVGRPHVHRV